MTTVRVGEFEWDAAKASSNLRKHRVSFLEAMEAFLDPNGITARDIEHEDRFVLIGMSQRQRILFVVMADGGERLRIISARRASPAQRRLYEDGPKS